MPYASISLNLPCPTLPNTTDGSTQRVRKQQQHQTAQLRQPQRGGMGCALWRMLLWCLLGETIVGMEACLVTLGSGGGDGGCFYEERISDYVTAVARPTVANVFVWGALQSTVFYPVIV